MSAPPVRTINPDCRDGKHPACNGDAWDHENDVPAACDCGCHPVLNEQEQQ